jgi:hypothetical protein
VVHGDLASLVRHTSQSLMQARITAPFIPVQAAQLRSHVVF